MNEARSDRFRYIPEDVPGLVDKEPEEVHRHEDEDMGTGSYAEMNRALLNYLRDREAKTTLVVISEDSEI